MNLRKILLILSFLAFFSVTAGGLLYYSSFRESVFGITQTQAGQHNERIKNYISSHLTNNQKAVRTLSGLRELKKAIENPEKSSLEEANVVLDHFTDSFDVSVSYLMDRKGKTIASSNRNDPDSFLGKNYSFRPYFKDAIHKNSSIYMALGVTSKKRGIYYSHAIYDNRKGVPIGVVVLKAGVDKIEEEVMKRQDDSLDMITFITGPHGIVFMSDHKEFLYRLLWPVTDENLIELSNSEQFGKGPFERTGFKRRSENRVVDEADNEYLIFQMPLNPLPGWNVVHLHSVMALSKMITSPFIGMLGHIVIAVCMLIGLSVFILYYMGKSNIVRRMKAEATLRQSEERFRLVFHTSPDSINLNRLSDGLYIDINEGFTNIMGYTREDAIGKTSLSLDIWKHPEDRKQLVDGLSKTGYVENLEARFIGKDGKIRVGLMSARILQINNENVILSITRDITERKRSEAILQASELKFRNIVDASPMGILLYELKEDDRLVFIGANLAADRILGIELEKFKGKTIEEAFPGLIDTEVPSIYRDVAKNGTLWRTDQIDYNEGSISGAFEVAAFQTEPNKMAVIFNEITARKRAEEALQESEEKFRTLVEESPLGISLIDKDGCYKYVNPVFREMFGFTLTDIPTGAQWFKKAYPDEKDRRKAMASWLKDIQQAGVGQSRPRVYSVTCKDGSRKEINFRPVTMENQDQFVIYEDITERSKMEQQLQQTQKIEAIGTLAGGIAHDFNNLLMGIQGRASLMAIEPNPSHSQQEHIGAIEEYVQSATDLTKQLLGFARGGKYEVKPIEINDLVLGSAMLFGRTRKEIRIHTKTQPASLVVEADKRQIEQVLLNLYINAWQAMPDGGELYLETATVRMDEADCAPHQIEPGLYIKISVTDTGTGMDAATRHRIFDPFYTTKDKGRGTGLGLASAYGIVRNHGGMINVYSEIGQGTTFNLYLPVSEKAVQREVHTERPIIRGSETVLLVDDEEMILDVGKAMMEKLGYRVMVARGGEPAIEAVRRTGEDIDLVILDLIMPGMDGSKVFDHIREIRPKIPVMLSSGYAINGQADAIMRRGCNGFIQKPFNISELSKQVRNILDANKN